MGEKQTFARERRDEYRNQYKTAFDSWGGSQADLAREMAALGWDNFSQITASRILRGQRSVPVEEYADLATILPLPRLGDSYGELLLELNDLRSFKRRVTEALS